MNFKVQPEPRTLSTMTLWVPDESWLSVKVGIATEFRTLAAQPVMRNSANPPTPVVLYNREDTRIMLLEQRRRETLFGISEDAEAIKRAGFENYETFRRWWRSSHDGHYAPLTNVIVWRVREFQPADIATMGERLLRDLYGPWLKREIALADF